MRGRRREMLTTRKARINEREGGREGGRRSPDPPPPMHRGRGLSRSRLHYGIARPSSSVAREVRKNHLARKINK